MTPDPSLIARASAHAALGDPTRLAIVDALRASDRSPLELRLSLGLESNHLAHHLDVLERAGLIERSRSSGDGRRRYVHLLPDALAGLLAKDVVAGPALFVCTANSARSQLAAALWRSVTGEEAASAGTHPATRVHPGAVAAARRAGICLKAATPRSLEEVTSPPALIIAVCNQAFEEQGPECAWLHWSIPDPVATGDPAAFDATVTELRARIEAVSA